MKNIIVTISNRERQFEYDMELAVDETVLRVTQDVMEILSAQGLSVTEDPSCYGLYVERIRRLISPQETLAQAGVRNGDYVTVVLRVRR